MKEYFIALLAAAILASILALLAPDGKLSLPLKALLSLFLVCALISPIRSLLQTFENLRDGSFVFPWEEEAPREDYEQQKQEALAQASKEYFTQSLTRMLESEFAIATGEVSCRVQWEETDGEELHPQQITVLLSGKAIWKDPHTIRTFVSELLECECTVALE